MIEVETLACKKTREKEKTEEGIEGIVSEVRQEFFLLQRMKGVVGFLYRLEGIMLHFLELREKREREVWFRA